MSKAIWFVAAMAGTATFLVSTGWADVPAPPVNQSIGMRDVLWSDMTGADCRVCHSSGIPDRHHLMYGKPIPTGSHVPYPDADGNGVPDTTYSCISCHGTTFTREVNCVVCHTASPHHEADEGDCKSCHGSIVDNRNDGHYVPTYSPSLVTPTPKAGDGLPPNSRGKGAGACDYCHDQDLLNPPVIRKNSDLHHRGFNCMWCHDVHGAAPIRVCEGCHGPNSLHNIQVDSPKTPTGAVVVGGEDAGYGHIGRDMGPGDSDCWGCHGFAMAAAPGSGPAIPTVYDTDKVTITAGATTTVVLTGAAFTNTMGNTVYESNVTLTAPDGTSVTLTPDVIVDQGSLAVTIPAGSTKPGNYRIKAKKSDFSSNPAVVSAVPKVRITTATAAPDRTVTIKGAGFAGYAAGSGTLVIGTNSAGKTIRGTVVSWAPGKIVAKFGTAPTKVKVVSVFGKATHAVVTP